MNPLALVGLIALGAFVALIGITLVRCFGF